MKTIILALALRVVVSDVAEIERVAVRGRPTAAIAETIFREPSAAEDVAISNYSPNIDPVRTFKNSVFFSLGYDARENKSFADRARGRNCSVCWGCRGRYLKNLLVPALNNVDVRPMKNISGGRLPSILKHNIRTGYVNELRSGKRFDHASIKQPYRVHEDISPKLPASQAARREILRYSESGKNNGEQNKHGVKGRHRVTPPVGPIRGLVLLAACLVFLLLGGACLGGGLRLLELRKGIFGLFLIISAPLIMLDGYFGLFTGFWSALVSP